MMRPYTPEDWENEPTRDHGAAYRVMDVQGVTIALIYRQPGDIRGTAPANRDLITRSKKLLEVMHKHAGQIEKLLDDDSAEISNYTGDKLAAMRDEMREALEGLA